MRFVSMPPLCKSRRWRDGTASLPTSVLTEMAIRKQAGSASRIDKLDIGARMIRRIEDESIHRIAVVVLYGDESHLMENSLGVG